MDCVGGDTKSVAEERDVNDGTEDMQDDLSTENSRVELREDDSVQYDSDFDSKGIVIVANCWVTDISFVCIFRTI